MIRKAHYAGLLLGALLLHTAAAAAEPNARIAGFGTVGLSCFSRDSADFINNEQPYGPGRSGRCDAGIDSALGLQFDVAMTPTLEFGLQAVADRNADRSFTPELTVAQLRWQATERLTLRAGRMPSAAFLHAENRAVRYSQPWLRAPLEVYGLAPLYSNDGVEAIYQTSLGAWRAEWQGGLSTIDFDLPISNTREMNGVEGKQAFLALLLHQGNTQFKIGYGYSRLSFRNRAIDTLLGALRTLPGGAGAALADDLAVDDTPAGLFAVGFQREQEQWLLLSEFGYRTVDGFERDQYGAYVTLGRRLGNWFPYATLARRWTRGPDTDSRAQLYGPAVAIPVDTLLAATRTDSRRLSLGLSRELHPQAILKLQLDHIRPDRDSFGLYTNHAYAYGDPAYRRPGSDWLFALSLDFVF